MVENSNLAALKAAYRLWNESKGHRIDGWLAIAADDIRLISMGEVATAGPLAFAAPRTGKEAFEGYLKSMLGEWTMVHWTPDTFVSEADRVAVFARCAWIYKRTGKTAEVRIAHLMTFKKGKIVECIEIFDSARAAAAAVA